MPSWLRQFGKAVGRSETPAYAGKGCAGRFFRRSEKRRRGGGAVSCRLTGAWAFVGRGVRLACRVRFVRLICWSLSFGPSRPTGTGAGFSSVGMESSPDLSGMFLSGRDDRLDCFVGLVSRQVRRLICPVCLPLVGNVVRIVLSPGRRFLFCVKSGIFA